MKDHFVSYGLTLKLKDLGFDDECIATIDQTEFVHIKGTKYPIRGAMCYMTIDVPLWQQAFDFFTEKYLLSGCYQARNIINGRIEGYYYRIAVLDPNSEIKGYSNFTKTINEAREKCLLKLIELCSK